MRTGRKLSRTTVMLQPARKHLAEQAGVMRLSTGRWRAYSTTTPAPGILSLTGIYNDGAYQMIMRGLSQKKGVDIMSAPSLLARPGEMAWTPQALPDQDEDDNCAKIEVVRRFIYPTAFDPPELSNSNSSNNNNNNNNNGWGNTNLPVATPANPSEWATEEVGIVLRFRVAEGEGDSDVIKFEQAFAWNPALPHLHGSV